MMAMLLTEIDHVAIAVSDLEAAIDYYQRAFGESSRRRHDAMAELGGEAVAIAGGARAGIRLPAAGEDYPVPVTRPHGRCNRELIANDRHLGNGFIHRHHRPAALEPPQQRLEHVGGLVADGENLTGLLDLGGDAFGFEKIDRLLHAEGGECGMEKFAGRPVGGDDAAIVGRLRDVAASAARHEDLDAGLAVFFQHEGASPALGGMNGGHEPCGAGADHDHVPGHGESSASRAA